MRQAGIAVDQAGNVYVDDGGNGRIQKFSSEGAFLTQWDTWGNVYAVSVETTCLWDLPEGAPYKGQ